MLRIISLFYVLCLVTHALENHENFLSIPNNEGLSLYKLSGSTEEIDKVINALSEIERLHTEDLSDDLSDPQGLYVIFKDNNIDTPIGVQSFGFYQKNGTSVLEATTDILDKFQGKGWGTKLRKSTTEYFSKVHKNVKYLYSINEWEWGENHESLKSSINAGYRIA